MLYLKFVIVVVEKEIQKPRLQAEYIINYSQNSNDGWSFKKTLKKLEI